MERGRGRRLFSFMYFPILLLVILILLGRIGKLSKLSFMYSFLGVRFC